MSRTKRSNALLSPVFCKAVKTAVNELLAKDDMDSCVSTAEVAAHKAVAKAFTVEHPERLRTLVMTAVSEGQIVGLASRKGRDGGIHRVKVAKARKPAAKTDSAANDTDAVAATGTDE